MPTDKPKIIIVIDEDLLEQVDAFSVEEGISRSKAIRRLMKTGLRMNGVFSEKINTEIAFAAFEGQTVKEIAQDLGIPQKAVRRVKRLITLTLSEWSGIEKAQQYYKAYKKVEANQYSADGSVKRKIKFQSQSSASD